MSKADSGDLFAFFEQAHADEEKVKAQQVEDEFAPLASRYVQKVLLSTLVKLIY